MPSFAPIVRFAIALGAITALSAMPAAAAEPRSSSPYTAVSIPLTRRNVNVDASGFVYRAKGAPYARASGGQPLGFDKGVGVFTIEATIGAHSFHMIPSFGTPNVILAQSSGYTGANKTGKALEETYGSPDNANYPVDIYLDTVKLSGMTAPGVAIGKARSDILIAKEATTKPVGILGLAPENEDAYVEQNKSFAALVTASGPTPFAFKLGDKSGTLQFGQFSPTLWLPLSKKGDTWDATGKINDVPFEQGTLDIQEDRLAMDVESAKKMISNMGLKPVEASYYDTKITTAEVDCKKGAPLTIHGAGGGPGVTISGPSSVQILDKKCYSLIQGYGGNQTFWIIPAGMMSAGAVMDIRGRRIGFGLDLLS